MIVTSCRVGAVAVVFGLAVFFSPSSTVCGQADETRNEEIVLGMSAAFTGPSRGLGIELYRGSMTYFEHINSKKNGVHGRKIRIKAYDDQYDPEPAIKNTIKLIRQDNVFLLFNYVGTPTTTRCLPLLKLHQDDSILLFFPFTGAQPQRQAPYDRFVFNFRASYYQETKGLVDRFVDVGRNRIAVFYQIDAYGRNGWEGVRTALKARQLKMTAEATYRRGASYETSLKEQVNILRDSKPDAVISIGSYAACAAFVRDARDAGWEVPIANVSFVGSTNMIKLLEQTGKQTGIDYTANLIFSEVVPSIDSTILATVKQYRELTKVHHPMPEAYLLQESYTPLDYNFIGLEGFVNAKLLVTVLEKMGPPFKRNRLKDAVESLHDFDLGIGVPVNFSRDRHQAVDQVYFNRVREGRFESLEEFGRWRK